MTTSAAALEPNPKDAKPNPTLDSSSRLPRPTSFADALPQKPSSGTAPGASLSYSAQVAEQFSSSYRQAPSQERGRLQFKNGAPPSPSTGAGSADGQARPVRPSEMKDEGCVFSLPLHSSYSVMLLYVMGGCTQLLSGSLYAYPISCYHPATMRFTRQMMLRRAWMASHLTFSYFFHILLPKMTMSKLSLVVLRYVALLRLRLSALHVTLCRLSPLRYYLDTSIQQDVCRRLILGYNRRYLYLCSFSPFTLLHFAMSYSFC